MKNNDDNVKITFNNECGWGDWEEPYIKEVLKHAKVNAVKIYVRNIEDDEQINILVTELDASSGEHIKQEYAIRFFEESAITGCLMFAHFLWKVDGYNMTLVDQAIYQIHRRNDGTRFCLLLAEESHK